MSLTKKVAYSTSIQALGKALSTGISLILVGVLTRYLGIDGYGKLVTIFAFTGLFNILADFGFFWILVRESSRCPENEEKIVSNIFTLRTIFAIITYGLGIIISLFISKYSDIKISIIVGSFAMLFMSLNSTMVSVCQTHLKMYKASISDIISRLLILLVIFVFVRFGYSLVMILLAHLIGNFVNFWLTFNFARKHTKISFKFDWSYWMVILRESFPMAIVVVFGFIYFKIDTIMLSIIKTPNDVGIYGPAYKVFENLLFFPAIFLGNIFPTFSRLANNENKEKLLQIFQKAFDFMSLVALPMVIGSVLFAKPIINIVGGGQFVTESTLNIFSHPATAVLVFQILSFAIGFSFINNVFGNLLISTRYQGKLVLPTISLAVFNILANLYFIPRYSYIGAAFTTVMTELLLVLINIYLIKKYVDILPKMDKIWRSILPVLGMIIIGVLLRDNFFVAALISVMVYFLLALLTKCFSKELIYQLVRKSESR